MKNNFDEQKVNVRIKLASLWTAFMFLYIYVDYFGLYKSGFLEGILDGKIFIYDISQAFLLAGLVSVSIPAIMIFLSIGLPAKISRLTNMIVATIYIPYSLFNLYGEAPWMHMVFGATVEVIILILIIRYAWNWPTLKK